MIIRTRKATVVLVAGAVLVGVGLDVALTISPGASTPATTSTPTSSSP